MQERFADRSATRKIPTFPLVNTEKNHLFKLSKETSDQLLWLLITKPRVLLNLHFYVIER